MNREEYVERIKAFGIKVGDILFVKEYFRMKDGYCDCITYHGDVTEVLEDQFNMNGNLSGAWVPFSLRSTRGIGGFFMIESVNGMQLLNDDGTWRAQS